MMLEVGCYEMKLLVLSLFLVCCFNVDAGFVENTKNWFLEMFSKGSAKVKSEMENLKSSTAGQQVNKFLDESKTAWQDNKHGTISSELMEARQKLLDCTKKLDKELEADIRSLSQLEDLQYYDRVVIYKDGRTYVQRLERALSTSLNTLADARKMKESVDRYVSDVVNVLTDELIYSYIDDLRQAYNTFKDAYEKLENDLKKQK